MKTKEQKEKATEHDLQRALDIKKHPELSDCRDIVDLFFTITAIGKAGEAGKQNQNCKFTVALNQQ